MIEIRKSADNLALGQFLSDFDAHVSFSNIMESMNDSTDWDDSKLRGVQSDVGECAKPLVEVWEPFDTEAPEDVATHIQNLHDNVIFYLEDILEPMFKIIEEGNPQTIADMIVNLKNELKKAKAD